MKGRVRAVVSKVAHNHLIIGSLGIEVDCTTDGTVAHGAEHGVLVCTHAAVLTGTIDAFQRVAGTLEQSHATLDILRVGGGRSGEGVPSFIRSSHLPWKSTNVVRLGSHGSTSCGYIGMASCS